MARAASAGSSFSMNTALSSLVDFELLLVDLRIGADGDGLAGELLHLAQALAALQLERLGDLRIDAQDQILALDAGGELAHFGVDLVADGGGRFHQPHAVAVGAGAAEGALEGLLHPLAGERDQAEVVEIEHLGGSAVGAHGLLEALQHALAVAALVHIDEINHNDAAEVAQANLAHDLLDGLEIGLHDGVFQPVGAADVLAGVDVNGHQRLGLVEHDVAAALQPDLALERIVDLLLDAEVLEHGFVAGVKADARGQGRHEIVHELDDALVLLVGVHVDLVEVGRELVAQGALDQVEVVVQQRGRAHFLELLAQIVPLIGEQTDVGEQLLVGGAGAGGAHDEAAGEILAVLEDEAFQPGALLIAGDAAGDADVMGRRHVDQETAGKREVAGDARPLLADGLLGDLDQNLLAGAEQITDQAGGGVLAGFAGLGARFRDGLGARSFGAGFGRPGSVALGPAIAAATAAAAAAAAARVAAAGGLHAGLAGFGANGSLGIRFRRRGVGSASVVDGVGLDAVVLELLTLLLGGRGLELGHVIGRIAVLGQRLSRQHEGGRF